MPKRILIAEMWRCGDDNCDCFYPELRLLESDPTSCTRWRLAQHWTGKWGNDVGSDEWQAACATLKEMAARYGLAMDDDYPWPVERELPEGEVIQLPKSEP